MMFSQSGSSNKKRQIQASPKLLRRQLLSNVILRFLGGEAFLMGLFFLADLFTSLWRILAVEAPLGKVLLWLFSGLPTYAVEVLPVAYLFAITLCLAELHADGELMVIWGSGISVQSLSLYVLAFSVFLSFSVFLIKDQIAIPTLLEKDRLYSEMTSQGAKPMPASNLTIMDEGGAMVYRVRRFDSATNHLSEVDIVERNAEGKPSLRILAATGRWDGESWIFPLATVYTADEEGFWTESKETEYRNPRLKASPEDFSLVREKPEHMKSMDLFNYIESLESSGLPSAQAKTELHKRFSFLLTPLIVYGLSIAFAGLFRKNSLLMSLLFSLGAATVYYVAQMLGSLAAKTGWLSPAAGIWTITLVFSLIAALGYSRART